MIRLFAREREGHLGQDFYQTGFFAGEKEIVYSNNIFITDDSLEIENDLAVFIAYKAVTLGLYDSYFFNDSRDDIIEIASEDKIIYRTILDKNRKELIINRDGSFNVDDIGEIYDVLVIIEEFYNE